MPANPLGRRLSYNLSGRRASRFGLTRILPAYADAPHEQGLYPRRR